MIFPLELLEKGDKTVDHRDGATGFVNFSSFTDSVLDDIAELIVIFNVMFENVSSALNRDYVVNDEFAKGGEEISLFV